MKTITMKILIICGLIAGPIFTLSWLIAGATRKGYNPLRHPVSSLSIGSYGWTQITTFLLTGILLLGFSVALIHISRFKRVSTSGAILIALCAIGLIGAAFFVSDPLSGYPMGQHTFPANRSVSGKLHDLFSSFFFLGFPFAAYKYCRYFLKFKNVSWAIYSFISIILFVCFFVFSSLGFGQIHGFVNFGGLFQRISISVVWCWMTILAIQMLKNEVGNIK